MKKILFSVLTAVLLTGSLVLISLKVPAEVQQSSTEHVYASWETIEYDKCVAAWIIKRFVDKDAKFVFYPSGTEIKEGIVFDVPGVPWSRQHLKCTSDCILEAYQFEDSVIKEIIKMAHDVELNFWKLDSFPEAQESFHQLKVILEKNRDNPHQCIDRASAYFDELYVSLKQK